MSQQDRTSDIVINHQVIKQVGDWLVTRSVFAGMKVRRGATWKPRLLAMAALLWALGDEVNLTDRFLLARKVVAKIFRWLLPPGTSYQGFTKMLRKWHVQLQGAIIPHLRDKMKKIFPNEGEIGGYQVFAGDGSRIELSRTQSLETAFSPPAKSPPKKKKGGGKAPKKKTKKNSKRRNTAPKAAKKRSSTSQSSESVRKKANSPQMWLTLLWHVGSGLPWAWRSGPSDSSERGHLQEMLGELPENSLITADAGFVGYDFWDSILTAGQHFLIRVGANVKLLKDLGCARQHAYTVYLWPDGVANKKQDPLVLRLIVVHNGKHPVYLVTDLTKSQLSDRQAGQIYAARWGIELFFRTFKQTFGRRKLRGRCAKNAPLELDWSLLGLWCVCLLGARELSQSGQDPTRLSPAAAISAVQSTLRDWRVRPETAAELLWSQLKKALLDDYQRTSSKTSRNYPRKKKREPIGTPQITKASKQQILAAKKLKTQKHEIRFAA